jgi:ATP-dependent Clp protease ATP-binding subunit ClpX
VGAIDPKDPTLFRHAEPDDLLRYGLIPELIGRLPVLTSLDALTREDLRRILTEPKNALVRQYQKLFAMDGIDLVLEDDALEAVVDDAIELHTGARGLRSILEQAMLMLMFEAPDTHAGTVCRITAATIKDGAPPVIEERKATA